MGKKIKHKIINNIELKRCNRCKEWNTLDYFSKDKTRWDNLCHVCKICCRQYNIAYAKKIKYRYTRAALHKTYALQLSFCEKTRHSPENSKLLQVKCAYCGKWYCPTNSQVKARIKAINGKLPGELRFYCSENCKQSCPTYHRKDWPQGFKKATSREVVPLLRQLVLKRDNWTCQKCGVTTKNAQLHVHHILSYMLNKMQANDPDSCITFCKTCHKEIHLQDGCRYMDLKCNNLTKS